MRDEHRTIDWIIAVVIVLVVLGLVELYVSDLIF